MSVFRTRAFLTTVAFLSLLLIVFATTATAQIIERWQTSEGKIHLGSNPPPGSKKVGESGWTAQGPGKRNSQAENTTGAPEGPRELPPALLAGGAEHQGRVVGVSDGDTVTVLVNRRELRVRLAEIDTPERGQPYGTRAKQALSRLVFGKNVRVIEVDVDRYGRTVGKVFVDGRDVNAAMVEGGHAWVYRDYAKNQALYALEDEARDAKRGLWALSEVERSPPWEWRRSRSPRAPPPIVENRNHTDGDSGSVIANRRSRIYHWPGCPNYQDVSPRNRVFFDSKAAAERAGYRAATNCP